MTVKKLRKQLAAAIAMTLVATVALGSSTYAWFSLNSKVTATGMNVQTVVKNNLLIAPADSGLTDTSVNENEFTTSRIDNVSAILQPTSTVDGKAYFYTDKSNVLGNGDHINDVFVAYNPNTGAEAETTNLAAFRSNAGLEGDNTVFGFKDYVFFLKAQNTSASDAAPVVVTGLNLVYGKAEIANIAEKAFRVAILAEDKDAGTGFAATPGTLKTILTVDAADSAPGRYFDSAQGVNSTSTLGSVSNLASAAVIGTVPANSIKYYKVVVRLWLEGEDQTCNNSTYVNFTDEWALDLQIELAPPTTVANYQGVTQINATYTATEISIPSNTAVATEAAYDFDNQEFYAVGDTGYYTDASGALTTTSRIFQMVDGHMIEITNKCKITTN